MTASGAEPDIQRMRNGLKVIVFEQAAEVLEKRLGFRETEYGPGDACGRLPATRC
jgi:hypothetical protein